MEHGVHLKGVVAEGGCIALCCRQMLHLLTYSIISASMPGQYRFALALS